MDYVIELLSTFVGDPARLRQVFVVLVGLAVFAVGISLFYLFNTLFDPLRQRVAAIAAHAPEPLPPDLAAAPAPIFTDRLAPLEKYIVPGSARERLSVAAKLEHAGFRRDNALFTFYAIKTISCVVLAVVALSATTLFPGLSTQETVLVLFGASFVGLIIPNLILEHLQERRVRHIRNGFPDALDLFVVCVESGLGLNATIQRVAEELDISHPELAQELDLVNAEMRLGADRITALRGLAHRTGLDEIRGLVTLLDQSTRFGTGIAETLRVYADEFRDKRMQRAEETAAKIGTKLIFPLTFCMWPSFFVVAIGPAVLKALQAFQ